MDSNSDGGAVSGHVGLTSTDLSAAIGEVIGATLHARPVSRAHGGSINECYRWDSDAGPLFVKVASADGRAMFEAEAAGLVELRHADAVRVPSVLGVGATGSNAWLALEWIQLGARTGKAEAALGARLASQHRSTAVAFGWHRDNTIGSTPQANGWLDDWVRFFRDRRLRYQLDLAGENGYGGRLQERGGELLERLGEFFPGYRPAPSLLHGDLWGGNWGVDELHHPVIFDPAVYYGDREVDLAMTRLFGGFGAGFYTAYESIWPLDAGARVRTDLYNSYHLLNHLNLFGGSYLGQALATMERLLRLID
jgi:protein-ribulosamine 3-kinase